MKQLTTEEREKYMDMLTAVVKENMTELSISDIRDICQGLYCHLATKSKISLT